MALTSNNVMIVDPSAAWRRRGCSLLRARGYKAHGFASGARALEYLQNHAVDMVIADFLSVKPSLVKWKKLTQKDARLVLLLRSKKPGAIAECFRFGAHDCLTKPLDEDSLFGIVRERLNVSQEVSVQEQAYGKFNKE